METTVWVQIGLAVLILVMYLAIWVMTRSETITMGWLVSLIYPAGICLAGTVIVALWEIINGRLVGAEIVGIVISIIVGAHLWAEYGKASKQIWTREVERRK